MLFKEAVSKRIYELCDLYRYTPNKLVELSGIPPSTFQDLLSLRGDRPNAYIIY